MKMKGTLIPLLVLSAVFVMPVFANDLNPALVFGSESARQDVRLNVGTLRHDVGAMRDMEGKEVRGKYNEYLGYILAVDEGGKLAEMQIPTGVALALTTDLLIDDGDHVSAPTISRGDVLAMIRKPGEHPLVEVKNER
jgi:hypothetical protein